MQTEPKLCKDCKHYRYVESSFDWCKHPNVATINLVSGNTCHGLCCLERTDSGRCTKDGKLFERSSATADPATADPITETKKPLGFFKRIFG